MRAIVIGGGPSLSSSKHLQLLAKSKFDGIIFCTDTILRKALEAGITPDRFNIIVITCEYHAELFSFFDSDICLKHAGKIRVKSYLNAARAAQWIKTKGYKVENQPEDPDTIAFGNVGGIAWLEAARMKLDEVVLIGMDHSMPISYLKNFPKIIQDNFFIVTRDYCIDPLYQYFVKTFLQYVTRFPIKTINCTGYGALYSEHIERKDFVDYLKT